MAKKKKNRKAPPRKGPWLIAILLSILVMATMTAVFYFIFLRLNRAPLKLVPVAPHDRLRPQLIVPPKETSPLPQKQPMAKVAIIIDDIGNQRKLADRIMDLDLNLSFSVLPYQTFSKQLAAKAAGLGRDILLHLPMEPQDHKWNPGEGALFLSMSKTKILSVLDGDLAQVPMAIGVNNHMGSRFTANRQGMGIVLKHIKNKGLFWLDSVTSAKSVGFKMARALKLKTAKRDVFLDNVQKADKIIIQLNHLLDLARHKGFAIGIAHPHPETLKALLRYQYTLRQEVKLVGIHEIMNEVGDR